MAKQAITHSEYMQLVALYTVAGTKLRELKALMDSANEIVGGDQATMDNHVNDVLWGSGDDPTADDLVASMNLTVYPPIPNEIVHLSGDSATAKCGDPMEGNHPVAGSHHRVTDRVASVTCEKCEAWIAGFAAAAVKESASADS